MGNKICKTNNKKDIQVNFVIKDLENAISAGDKSRINKIIDRLLDFGITSNSLIIKAGKWKISPLAFAFLVGNPASFEVLNKSSNDLAYLNKVLLDLKIDPFYYLCECGYSELLVHLLPIFSSFYKQESSFVDTLSFGDSYPQKLTSKSTPIQRACEKEHIHVVIAIYNYYKDKPFVPFIFDLEKPDEKKGDNCALITCRTGNLALIRALHKICNANFLKLNSCNENGLIVCMSGYKKRKLVGFVECFKYLVENVKIDLSFKYEELLLLSSGVLVEYIEFKLEKIGIFVKKSELEESEKAIELKKAENDESLEEEEKVLPDYLFQSDYGSNNSILSSISYRAEYRASFFLSEIGG